MFDRHAEVFPDIPAGHMDADRTADIDEIRIDDAVEHGIPIPAPSHDP